MPRTLQGLSLALITCLSGCAEESPRSASRQEALLFPDAGPSVTGANPGAQLGAVVAPCPGGGFVASAAGDHSVWLSPSTQRIAVPNASAAIGAPSFPVACQGSGGSFFRALVGGTDFANSVFADATVIQLAGFRVDSFAVPPSSSLQLAVGDARVGTVSLYRSDATSLTSPLATIVGDGGFGASLAWNELGLLVVGNPQLSTVFMYFPTALPDGGLAPNSPFTVQNPEPAMIWSDFGRVVLTGNVTAQSGVEVIVAAPLVGRVYIFSGGVHSMTLQGGASFGASLAVDPRDLGGGLHALWVGEPAEETIHRFVGDAGTAYFAPATLIGSQFGAGLAVDARGVVSVGAPLYSEGARQQVGAVFEARFDAGVLSGTAMECAVGGSCSLGSCLLGSCVGGVFCQKVGVVTCAAGQVCGPTGCVALVEDAGIADAGALDAGAPDAGLADAGVDAGEPLDAGEPDAGEPPDAGVDAGVDAGIDAGADAGSTADADAGLSNEREPLVFRTCGCTSGGLPALLLGLLLARRRAR